MKTETANTDYVNNLTSEQNTLYQYAHYWQKNHT